MALDDLDRKLAQAAAKAGLVPPARLAELSQKADAQKTTLARVLLAELPQNRDPLLGILRSLNAGFPAHDEDALDRHEDRLIARLALRVNALDAATARGAVSEQETRRARGEPIRLGELLVEQGKIDAATAERLYRQFENAAVVCQDCFAPNQRNRAAEGTPLECPRCGTSAPVPPPAVKPGWTQMGAPRVAGAASDLVFAQANEVVVEAAKKPAQKAKPGDLADTADGEDGGPVAETEAVPDEALPPKTPSGRNAKLAAQKRRRPNLAPQKKGSKAVALIAIGGVAVLFAAIIAVFVIVKPGEGQARYGKFQDVVKLAREKKTGGAIEEAAQAYGSALDLFKDVKPPQDAQAAIDAARKEHEVCADFAKRTAKIASDGDATPLCELAKTCEDHDVLLALVNRLAKSKDTEAVAGLVLLSSSKDDEVRRVALHSALVKGGTAALPLIEKIIERDGDPFEKDALTALLRINDKAAIPTIGKALDRFPKQERLWLSAAVMLAAMKDPAAVSLLKKLAKDTRSPVSEAAISGLAKVAPHEAVAELVAGLDGGDQVAASCAEQLKKMGDSAIAPLSAALAGGQTTAAVPLLAIATPRSIGAITDTLPKLAWEKRGALLELLCAGGTAPPGWMASTVGKIVQEARDGLLKKDPKLTRTILQQVVLAAKTFGFPDAAKEIKFELRFIELADRKPLPIDQQNLEVSDQDDPAGEPRLELRNFIANVRLVLYARGPEIVELHAVSNTESGRVVAPGKYDVWVARIAEDGREVDPARATLELATGKVTAIQYGARPDPDEAARSTQAGRVKRDEPSTPGESESEKLKRIFDRGFRAEQLVEEARKTLAERLKAESPWSKAQETGEKTPHYKVLTDAGDGAAKKVAAELEKAWTAYANILSAPADVSSGGFVVRFFKQKGDYDRWRGFTSLSAIYTEQLARDRKLPARARALAEKAKAADSEGAARLVQLADAIEASKGVEELEVEHLEELDDELKVAEKVTDPKLLARAVARCFFVARGAAVLVAASGRSPHGTILGHYNHASRELCLFEVEGWERTLRHEAFHQFLFAHAAKAPSWLHEGLATYFEALDKKGKNAERLAELRRAHETQSVLESLKLSSLLATERLSSLDYAISWSLIYYLVENEPQALGKILARAREGKASTFGVVSAFEDMLKTEEGWQKLTRKIVLE